MLFLLCQIILGYLSYLFNSRNDVLDRVNKFTFFSILFLISIVFVLNYSNKELLLQSIICQMLICISINVKVLLSRL